ncbi:MAG: hypothetical protein D6735_05970 [Acidobacteria bacterium]|nr:MAG: hypothetical protein D6735_05970 [Acidobacteriota bacterium]
MATETLFTAIDTASQIVLGVAGLLISWFLYRQSQQRAKDTWLRTYAEIHSLFWNDPAIQEVRCWLAYPTAYTKLRSVLVKRYALDRHVEGTPELEKEEYEILDKLDKYLNVLMRAVTVNPRLSGEHKDDDFWSALHFKYWLNACLDVRREELVWYVQKFYKPLYDFGQKPEMIEYGRQLGFSR